LYNIQAFCFFKKPTQLFEKFGMKRGNIPTAIQEAIEQWIKEK